MRLEGHWSELRVWDDVMPGRDDPENFQDFEKKFSWGWLLKQAFEFLVSDQIGSYFLGLDWQRWIEILNITKYAMHEGVTIVCLAYAFRICVSLLVSSRTEGRKK